MTDRQSFKKIVIINRPLGSKITTYHGPFETEILAMNWVINKSFTNGETYLIQNLFFVEED